MTSKIIPLLFASPSLFVYLPDGRSIFRSPARYTGYFNWIFSVITTTINSIKGVSVNRTGLNFSPSIIPGQFATELL